MNDSENKFCVLRIFVVGRYLYSYLNYYMIHILRYTIYFNSVSLVCSAPPRQVQPVQSTMAGRRENAKYG